MLRYNLRIGINAENSKNIFYFPFAASTWE